MEYDTELAYVLAMDMFHPLYEDSSVARISGMKRIENGEEPIAELRAYGTNEVLDHQTGDELRATYEDNEHNGIAMFINRIVAEGDWELVNVCTWYHNTPIRVSAFDEKIPYGLMYTFRYAGGRMRR